MLDIKSKIIKGYDETKIGKLLYDGLPWYKRIDTWLFIGTAILSLLPIILMHQFKYDQAYMLIFFVLLFFGSMMLVIRVRKQQLRKKNINVEKLKFGWVSEEYEEKKYETCYSELVKNGVLAGDSKDIALARLRRSCLK